MRRKCRAISLLFPLLFLFFSFPHLKLIRIIRYLENCYFPFLPFFFCKFQLHDCKTPVLFGWNHAGKFKAHLCGIPSLFCIVKIFCSFYVVYDFGLICKSVYVPLSGIQAWWYCCLLCKFVYASHVIDDFPS